MLITAEPVFILSSILDHSSEFTDVNTALEPSSWLSEPVIAWLSDCTT